MRTCHQCFVPCFSGLLGPHFNTLDLFISSSIHLAGFLRVHLILLNFFCLFLQKASQSLFSSQTATARAGGRGAWGQTWPWGREALAAGPGRLRLRFLSVKPRAGEQMRQRWQRHRLPGRPLCNQLSSQQRALCPCAWGLGIPPSPLFRHLRVTIRL